MIDAETLFILFLIVIAALGLQLLGKLMLKYWFKSTHNAKSRGS